MRDFNFLWKSFCVKKMMDYDFLGKLTFLPIEYSQIMPANEVDTNHIGITFETKNDSKFLMVDKLPRRCGKSTILREYASLMYREHGPGNVSVCSENGYNAHMLDPGIKHYTKYNIVNSHCGMHCKYMIVDLHIIEPYVANLFKSRYETSRYPINVVIFSGG